MKNRIHNATGEFPAIAMGLDIPDRSDAERFIGEVVATSLEQRMMSPPETANMTVTIPGRSMRF